MRTVVNHHAATLKVFDSTFFKKLVAFRRKRIFFLHKNQERRADGPVDCLLVENPIKGVSMDLHSKSIKCNKRSPAFSSFKEKECRAFYCIYFKLPHNTSKKLLRKEQIQLIVVHARRILVPHAALIPHAGAVRHVPAPHRSRYANQRPDTPCPRSPPP